MLQFKEFLTGRLPGPEWHDFEEIGDGAGIKAIGFAALQPGGGEVLDGFGIDDHDLDSGCAV